MSSRISVTLKMNAGPVRTALEQFLGGDHHFYLLDPKGMEETTILIMEPAESDPDGTFSKISAQLKAFPKTDIFLTSANISSEFLLQALRAGVKEVIPQPINLEELRKVFGGYLERRVDEPTPEQKPTNGKVLCFLGAKGGVGVSSVTTNLGVSLQKLGKTVVMVDLNLQGGDLPLFLDLEPSRSFQDVAKSLSRLDVAFLTSCLSTHQSGLSLLPLGEEERQPGEENSPVRYRRLSPACIEKTISLLQTKFNYVLVDCGSGWENRFKKLFDMSQAVFLTLTLGVPVIRKTHSLLELWQDKGLKKENLKIVVNRYSSEVEVLLRETQETLKLKPYSLITEDAMAALSAINTGLPLPLSAPRAVITKNYFHFASSILGKSKGANISPGPLLEDSVKKIVNLKDAWAGMKHKLFFVEEKGI